MSFLTNKQLFKIYRIKKNGEIFFKVYIYNSISNHVFESIACALSEIK